MSEETTNTNQGNAGMPPKNYLVESILVTIFCCLPFGIAGIVNASKVESAYRDGRIEEANAAAANAKKWTKIGFIVGLVVGILYIALNFLLVGTAAFMQ